MAAVTVTGITAARAQVIEDTTIVDGSVVGDDLILEQRDGTQINAGNVRGATGATGATGGELPTGFIAMAGFSDTLPPGWVICDGSELSRTGYSDLFGKIGTAFGAGDGATTFNVPDMRSAFPLGALDHNSIGETGGYQATQLPAHTHETLGHQHTTPAHQHQMNHGHTGAAGSDTHSHGMNSGGSHAHSTNTKSTTQSWANGTSSLVNTAYGTTVNTSTGGSHVHGIHNDTHTHSIAVYQYTGKTSNDGASLTGSAGAGTTTETGNTLPDGNMPPYVKLAYLIKT